MDGRSNGILQRAELTCHCLLVETGGTLILVDTGFGLNDVRDPQSRLSAFFLELVRPEFREKMTAIRQIERLGFDPRDVRHIVLTHLDFDHAGGLDDFPWAKVHLMEAERVHAKARRTWMDRQRFRPQQWSTQANWVTYDVDPGGDGWFGFERVRALEGLPDDIAMIPLIGHTFGHAGIAVRSGGLWRLLAGDAYFYHQEMNHTHPWCTPGLQFYQVMLEKDRAARLENQRRLRELGHERGGQVSVFCSHDVTEFRRQAGRSPSVPAEAISARTRVA